MRARLHQAVLVATTLVCGCTHHSDGKLYPADTEDLRTAKREAKTCANPAFPRMADGNEFKYGCFCGANHPAHASGSMGALSSLSPTDKATLVAKYFGALPFDDLDSLCRDHDVCWIINGGPTRDCNEHFGHEMLKIASDFATESAQKWRNPAGRDAVNPRASSCASLALHITQATAVFEGKSDSAWTDTYSKLIDWSFGAIAAVIAVPALPLTSSNYPDPTKGEKCNLSDNAASKLPSAVMSPR